MDCKAMVRMAHQKGFTAFKLLRWNRLILFLHISKYPYFPFQHLSTTIFLPIVDPAPKAREKLTKTSCVVYWNGGISII